MHHRILMKIFYYPEIDVNIGDCGSDKEAEDDLENSMSSGKY